MSFLLALYVNWCYLGYVVMDFLVYVDLGY